MLQSFHIQARARPDTHTLTNTAYSTEYRALHPRDQNVSLYIHTCMHANVQHAHAVYSRYIDTHIHECTHKRTHTHAREYVISATWEVTSERCRTEFAASSSVGLYPILDHTTVQTGLQSQIPTRTEPKRLEFYINNVRCIQIVLSYFI